MPENVYVYLIIRKLKYILISKSYTQTEGILGMTENPRVGNWYDLAD